MAKRTADTEPLLHDSFHLLPYLRPMHWSSPPTSVDAARAAAAAAALQSCRRRTIQRLGWVGGLQMDGGAALSGLPDVAIGSARQARDALHDVAELADIGCPMIERCLQQDADLERRRERFDPFVGNAMSLLGSRTACLRLVHAYGTRRDAIAVSRPSCTRSRTGGVGDGDENANRSHGRAGSCAGASILPISSSSAPAAPSYCWAAETSHKLPIARSALQVTVSCEHEALSSSSGAECMLMSRTSPTNDR